MFEVLLKSHCLSVLCQHICVCHKPPLALCTDFNQMKGVFKIKAEQNHGLLETSYKPTHIKHSIYINFYCPDKCVTTVSAKKNAFKLISYLFPHMFGIFLQSRMPIFSSFVICITFYVAKCKDSSNDLIYLHHITNQQSFYSNISTPK